MTTKRRILVIAAHPDDEILGCGGTMAKHVASGDEVHTLILAEGITSRDSSRDEKARKDDLLELIATANKANSLLGVSSV